MPSPSTSLPVAKRDHPLFTARIIPPLARWLMEDDRIITRAPLLLTWPVLDLALTIVIHPLHRPWPRRDLGSKPVDLLNPERRGDGSAANRNIISPPRKVGLSERRNLYIQRKSLRKRKRMNALLPPLPLWYLLGRRWCVCVLGVWRRDIFDPKEESSTFFLCMTDFAYLVWVLERCFIIISLLTPSFTSLFNQSLA